MVFLKGLLELTKPRIATMVLVTAAFGFFLGTRGKASAVDLLLLCLTLLGTGLASAGSATLNNVIERKSDALMLRTRNRVLPSGRMSPVLAGVFGVCLAVVGTSLLYVYVNALSASLVAVAVLSYSFIYTPLKRLTWLNTSIGAVPGAIPPMIGWAAATGELGLGAWVLFGILFAWQHPHFYSIAWMYREDYARAGLKMLPSLEPDGKRTFVQVIGFSILLILVSLLPRQFDLAGWIYASGAALLGLWFFSVALRMTREKSLASAKSLLRASIIYLPALFVLIVLDR